MRVEARLLGPVTLTVDGAHTPVGGANALALLAALLITPGQPVAVQQLITDIWGDAAPKPPRSRAQLHSLVSRLRTHLRAANAAAPALLQAQDKSYLLDVDPTRVDVTRFRALADQGRAALADGRPGAAHDLLDRALACWSGPALGGVRTHGRLEEERQALEALRLETLGLRIDADLHLDRPAAVIPELRALTAEFPASGRFGAQLAEALERTGRATEARQLRQAAAQPGRAGETGTRTPTGTPPEDPSTAAPATTAQPGRPSDPAPDPDELRISLLGPVRARRGTTELPLGSPQQRAVLAMLAARAGRRMSIQDIIDSLWDYPAPSQAVAAVRTYVSRLRKALVHERPAARADAALVSVSDGYELQLPRTAVDLHVFENLLAEAGAAHAAGDHATAARTAADALALWHGDEALAALPGFHAGALRTKLAEQRIDAAELLLASRIELGHGAEVITELSELTRQHPLRERPRELLMLALYRGGRQAEALGVYTDTRKLLIEELGVEPGAGLASMHTRILAGDPALAQTPAAAGRDELATVPAPAQLPANVADFTGRSGLVHELRATLRGGSGQAPVVASLSGIGGVGKTTLAVHVAHSLRADFPDGQLYVDLRGAGLRGPADPAAVLGDFLYALGVAEPPDSFEQRAALYRSLLADRRMLVLLDNVADARQVMPLVPGAPGSAVLITSRPRLAQLPGAHLLDVAELTPQEAFDLFAAIAGRHRVDAEPEAALAVVTACGFLPLAVRIAAARLASRPRWSVSDLARRLADQRRRLSELQLGNLAVETIIGLGYGQLRPEEARAFRLLSLINVPDLPLSAIAALLGTDEDLAEDLAESLVEANMLESHTPGRYRFHDLLRLYARSRNEALGDTDAQQDALIRLLDFLLATTRSVVQAMGLDDMLPDPQHSPSTPGLVLHGDTEARDWLHSAVPLVLGSIEAAAPGPAALVRPAVDLAVALTEVLEDWGPAVDPGVLDAVAAAARSRRDLASLGRIRYAQGNLHVLAGKYGRAEEAFRDSLSLQGPHDMTRLRAVVSVRLAVLLGITGRSGEALPLYEQALGISRIVGPATAETHVLARMSREYVHLGMPEEGVGAGRSAVEAARATGSTPVLADTLYHLGVVLAATGTPAEAIDRLREAVALFQSRRQRLWEGYALARLAASLLATGQDRAAAEAADESLTIAQELDAPYCQGLANAALGEALLKTEQTARALACLQEAHSALARLGATEAAAVVELIQHVGANR
ncbi:AfsR/SARP family transcriptional regulator [Kitasatospora sp. NPDC090091]|uniref:AfsR/SARP family transcriptional regulator n=1 Tax=Kitasatospora sp. NPDC090091 TaxID=3364081 RepID=UPI0037F38156